VRKTYKTSVGGRADRATVAPSRPRSRTALPSKCHTLDATWRHIP